MAKLRLHGRFSPRDGDIPARYELLDLRGDATGPHLADYLKVWGYVDGRGGFVPAMATLVSEDWRLTPEDRWSRDQWILHLRLDGSLLSAHRQVIVETRDGRILDLQPGPADAPQARAKLSALLRRWLDFRP